MAQVHFPRSLAALLPGLPCHLSAEAASVQELIEGLDARWPGLRYRLCDAGPAIREHINIFVDGERATLATVVRAGSEVHIIAAVSGG